MAFGSITSVNSTPPTSTAPAPASTPPAPSMVSGLQQIGGGIAQVATSAVKGITDTVGSVFGGNKDSVKKSAELSQSNDKAPKVDEASKSGDPNKLDKAKESKETTKDDPKTSAAEKEKLKQELERIQKELEALKAQKCPNGKCDQQDKQASPCGGSKGCDKGQGQGGQGQGCGGAGGPQGAGGAQGAGQGGKGGDINSQAKQIAQQAKQAKQQGGDVSQFQGQLDKLADGGGKISADTKKEVDSAGLNWRGGVDQAQDPKKQGTQPPQPSQPLRKVA